MGYPAPLPSDVRDRIGEAYRRLRACDLCPRRCGADRARGETGRCGVGGRARVASAGPHFGEERPLVGTGGSGTVFLGGCNLGCVFCQNHDIAHRPAGPERSPAALAGLFLALQGAGCVNVNWVTPTHVLPQLLAGAARARLRGLRIPIVYNTSAYDAVDALRLLDGVVDVYMPDLKWVDPEVGRRLAGAPDYWDAARAAVREMHRQVGDLVVDARGVAVRGLLVRHLVMPGDLAGTAEVVRFLAEEISSRTYLNVMAQYRPAGPARGAPGLDRRISRSEHRRAVSVARAAGLRRLDRG